MALINSTWWDKYLTGFLTSIVPTPYMATGSLSYMGQVGTSLLWEEEGVCVLAGACWCGALSCLCVVASWKLHSTVLYLR